MPPEDISPWTHTHDFCGEFSAAEKRTRYVLWLTITMMAVEIVAGQRKVAAAMQAEAKSCLRYVILWVIS